MRVPISARSRVRDVMTKEVVTVESSASVQEAAELMNGKNIGSLVVVEQGAPVGIITERDIVRKVVARRRNPEEVRVSEIMSKPLIHVSPNAFIFEAAEIMGKNQIRRLPVIEREALVGIITMYDIIKHYREMAYSLIDMMSAISRI